MRELRYAVAIEKEYTKDEILERYLNIAYFGDGAYGIEAASRHYFNKSAADLNLDEAATLAGIVPYPVRVRPDGEPPARDAAAEHRADAHGPVDWADHAAVEEAERTPLKLHLTSTPNGCVESSAPFFCDYVQREILDNPVFGPTPAARKQLLQRGGLTIRTTLDPKMQRAAQHAVDHYVPPKNSSHKAVGRGARATRYGRGPRDGRWTAPSARREKDGKTWVNFAADCDHGTSIGMQAGLDVQGLHAGRRAGPGHGVRPPAVRARPLHAHGPARLRRQDASAPPSR